MFENIKVVAVHHNISKKKEMPAEIDEFVTAVGKKGYRVSYTGLMQILASLGITKWETGKPVRGVAASWAKKLSPEASRYVCGMNGKSKVLSEEDQKELAGYGVVENTLELFQEFTSKTTKKAKTA